MNVKAMRELLETFPDDTEVVLLRKAPSGFMGVYPLAGENLREDKAVKHKEAKIQLLYEAVAKDPAWADQWEQPRRVVVIA